LDRRPQDLSDAQLQFYAEVSKNVGARVLVHELYVPKETGGAFEVPKHHVVRITCSDGPQVCDFNAFARNDPSEYFWSARTRTLHGSHSKVGRRLWGTEPNMRPMFTFITDTVVHPQLPHNARTHDLVYSRCSERAWELRTGKRHLPNCNSNMKTALRMLGFADDYVHDAFNIFMTTGIDDDHRLFYLDSQAKKGDYVELYAEIDTMCAISSCPGGCNGPVNHGLTVEVFSQPMRHDWDVIRS
jgi:uncharacterized protein YcgI (DUF1989 family)